MLIPIISLKKFLTFFSSYHNINIYTLQESNITLYLVHLIYIFNEVNIFYSYSDFKLTFKIILSNGWEISNNLPLADY